MEVLGSGLGFNGLCGGMKGGVNASLGVVNVDGSNHPEHASA